MCLSRTLLPLPLGPMMAKISPGRDLQVDAFEHLLPVEALAQVAHFHRNAGQWLGGEFISERKARTRVRK